MNYGKYIVIAKNVEIKLIKYVGKFEPIRSLKSVCFLFCVPYLIILHFENICIMQNVFAH